MDYLIFRRPNEDSIEVIHNFFEEVLIDTFKKNGIYNLKDTLFEEIEDKKITLQEDFDSNGEHRYFLFAYLDDQLVGSIEYGIQNNLIRECTDNQLEGIPEIGTVFVHPNFQGNRISECLIREMSAVLLEKGIKEVCFDSGYVLAQKLWRKRYGEPEYFLEDYWGKGAHHMVWRVNVIELLRDKGVKSGS